MPIQVKIILALILSSLLCYGSFKVGVNSKVAEYELKWRIDKEKQEAEFKVELQREIDLANYWRDRAIEYSQTIPEPATKVIKEVVYKNPDCTVIHGITSLYQSASERFKATGN
jgi:hypothetical protein